MGNCIQQEFGIEKEKKEINHNKMMESIVLFI